MVSADEKSAIAVIPGISIEKNDRHAFIQIFDAGNKESYYVKYDFEKFVYSKKTFNVSIGKSHFSDKGIILDIDDDIKVKGEFKFGEFVSWPISLFSPGVMGPYSFVPTMECYHGVMSFNHNLTGSLNIDGTEIDFNGGKGYCEKDWGISMPSSWVWMQSNHFENDNVSFFASIANIPWKRTSFTGFLAGLYIDGKIHRFATYTGAKVKKLEVTGNHVIYEIADKKRNLIITGDRAEGVTLAAPKFGEMSTKIQETLASNISVEMIEGGRVIFKGNGRNAGLEFVGDISELTGGI